MKDSMKSTMSGSNLLMKRKGLSNTGLFLLITVSLFILLYVIASIMFADKNFVKYSVFFNLINTKAYLLVLALGVTVVLITGSIDISVGAVTALVGMVIATMLKDSGVSAVWTIPAALVVGLVFGILQGFLVSYMEIQPFIVTLAGMYFARGITAMINNQSVGISDPMFLSWSSAKVDIPFLSNVRENGTIDTAYLTPAAIVALAVLIVLIIALKKTKFGRSLYAVGGNPQSALLMGVNVKKTKFLAHSLCGLLAGIGGILFTLLQTSGDPTKGIGYEIDAISSSVIGGVLLSGGVGVPIGTFFGVLINALINNVVTLLKMDSTASTSWPRVITSAFLLAFIVIQSVIASASKKGGFKMLLPEWLKLKSKENKRDISS